MPKLNSKITSTSGARPPAWRYKCGKCGYLFEIPAPSGPAEEKGHACPRCKSKNIIRVEVKEGEACPPGG